MVELPKPPTPTLSAIYAAFEARQGDGFRDHLGASLIGKSCARALWYDFRWVTPTRHTGRILRLFETGQLEEARLVRDLRATGATVLEVDPETGRQFRVEAHGGHFGGSLDGVVVGLIEAPKTWHVVEFKTHSAKSFATLVAKGVVVAKPQHAAQMQIYMQLLGLTRALYVAVCKDTDALHIERIEVDHEMAARLLEKAGRIIFAEHPPERISQDPAWFECRFCDHHAVCHGGGAAAVTCRSCLHSTPVEGGWRCARHGHMPNSSDQRIACSKHLFIPDLVPGEVVDAGDDIVMYRMRDGSAWTNDAREEEVAAC
ncbi:MAG: PD-(D/E)XK nuclease family protein [Beijerinckiaceae bacterium]|nr:PD-(D/E)XK nuclease family protein [Beijerinckiaceae bacterium]